MAKAPASRTASLWCNSVCGGLLLVTLTTASLIGGCGFHLRGQDGSRAADLGHMHIKAQKLPPSLRHYLEQLNSQDKQADYGYRLRVHDYYADKRRFVQAASSINDEYLLIREVRYSLELKDGRLLGPATSSVQTVFQDNAGQAISKSNEEQRLVAELEQRLAQDMMRQLQALLEYRNDGSAPNPTSPQ